MTEAQRASVVEEELKGLVGEKGRITFAEFMEVALFSPNGGYYTTGREVWGGGTDRGDYATNLDISPLFARTTAAQVREMWGVLGEPETFDLVEQGAGRGLLSKGILAEAGALDERFQDALRVHLVEKNPTLAEPPTDRVRWHADLSGAGRPVTGCVLSNELVDSFPVHRVVGTDKGIEELYVALDNGRFVDEPGPPSTPELSAYLEDAGVVLAPGQRGEVNLAAIGWMRDVARLLDRGFVITIDYGWPAHELYSEDRLTGTLACHYRHMWNNDPFTNIGTQDITAHVDFSTLSRVGRECGLETTGFTTQKNFLLGLGIAEEVMDTTDGGVSDIEAIRRNQEIKQLIMPGGPGDVFKVLIQHKGVTRPVLSGLSFRDISRYL